MASSLLARSEVQLAATALVSGLAVAAAILGYQELSRESRLDRLKRSIPDAEKDHATTQPPPSTSGNKPRLPTTAEMYDAAAHALAADDARREDALAMTLAARAQQGDFDPDLIAEALARNAAFFSAMAEQPTTNGDGAAAVAAAPNGGAPSIPPPLAKLRASFVVVVGLGGVGSHCCVALARSGVGRIRVVDFDQVSLSSLNRHAVATLADVGTSKVGCMRRRLAAVAPWVRVQERGVKFDLDDEPAATAEPETAEEAERRRAAGVEAAELLLGPWGEGRGPRGPPRRRRPGQTVPPPPDEDAAWEWDSKRPDYVVDAIDNVDTKVGLLAFCHARGIPVVSAMGAACKSDPTRIQVADVSAGSEDPLARSTRRKLKLKHGIVAGIPMVFSTERAGDGKAELLPLPDEELAKGQVAELGVLARFRVRILPVLGTMPAVFGYTVANHVILSITGYPQDYIPLKGNLKLYDSAMNAAQSQEEKIARIQGGGDADIATGIKVPLNISDVAFLIEDVFRGRSVVSGSYTRLILIRWRKPESDILVRIGEGEHLQKTTNLRLGDLVCMTKEEAVVHEKEVLRGGKAPEALYDADIVQRALAKMRDAAGWEACRRRPNRRRLSGADLDDDPVGDEIRSWAGTLQRHPGISHRHTGLRKGPRLNFGSESFRSKSEEKKIQDEIDRQSRNRIRAKNGMGQEESRAMLEGSVPPQTLQDRSLAAVAELIKSGKAQNIVVLTGAGISTAAGIPDFRSPTTGLYANLARLDLPFAEAVFDLSFFRRRPEPFYVLARELYPGAFQPTVSHAFIALLAQKGLLSMLFTQNIDCLERAAGVPPDRIVEAHGSFASQRCIDCTRRFPDAVMKTFVAEGKVPRCWDNPERSAASECVGLVKPDIVFFGEPLPNRFHEQRRLVERTADLVMVLGTSLTVHPFAALPDLAPRSVPRVLFNMEKVGSLGYRPDDVLALGECDEGVRELARELGWEVELEKVWRDVVGDEEAERQIARGKKKEEGKDELEGEVRRMTDEVEERLKEVKMAKYGAGDYGEEQDEEEDDEEVRKLVEVVNAKLKLGSDDRQGYGWSKERGQAEGDDEGDEVNSLFADYQSDEGEDGRPRPDSTILPGGARPDSTILPGGQPDILSGIPGSDSSVEAKHGSGDDEAAAGDATEPVAEATEAVAGAKDDKTRQEAVGSAGDVEKEREDKADKAVL